MNAHVKEFLLCQDANLRNNYTSLLQSHNRGLDRVAQNVARWQFETARRLAIKSGTLQRGGRIPPKQFRNEPRFI